MTKRLTDRYGLDRIRFTRNEPHGPLHSELLVVVDGIVPGGSVYHVLNDTPDETGDLMTILIDGVTVVHFEKPRVLFGGHRVVDGRPCDVQVETLGDFRLRIGQGKYRILLDHAVEDARRLLA